jgi:hypothetical protein
MTTHTLPRPQDTALAIRLRNTTALIHAHEGAYAYSVLSDLRERLRACEDDRERMAVCQLWVRLYVGEKGKR